LPRNPPQLHHDFTITKNVFFPKHPSKTPTNPQKPYSTTTRNFPQKLPPESPVNPTLPSADKHLEAARK
jgi:hypothetical protein